MTHITTTIHPQMTLPSNFADQVRALLPERYADGSYTLKTLNFYSPEVLEASGRIVYCPNGNPLGVDLPARDHDAMFCAVFDQSHCVPHGDRRVISLNSLGRTILPSANVAAFIDRTGKVELFKVR